MAKDVVNMSGGAMAPADVSKPAQDFAWSLGDMSVTQSRASVVARAKAAGVNRRVLAAMVAGTETIAKADMSIALARLATVFPKRGDGNQTAAEYHKALSDLTPAELTYAVDAVIAKSGQRYFPFPGELRASVSDKIADRLRVQRGAQRALEITDHADEFDTSNLPSAEEILKRNGRSCPEWLRRITPQNVGEK